MNNSDLLQSYLKDAMSPANVLYNLCIQDKLNSINPPNFLSASAGSSTFKKIQQRPLSKFKKMTVPIDAIIGPDCTCNIDIYKICESFDAHSVGNIDIMFFDDTTIIDEIILINVYESN